MTATDQWKFYFFEDSFCQWNFSSTDQNKKGKKIGKFVLNFVGFFFSFQAN